jgi:hypothetical protein
MHASRFGPRRFAASLVAVVAGMLAGPTPSRAQGIPPVSPPVCVANCPEDNRSDDSDGERPHGGLFNLIDRISEAREAARERRRAEAHAQNEQGVAEFKRGNYAEALRLFRGAEGNDPKDTVIRDNVKNAEAALAAQRDARERDAKLRKEQEDFRRGTQKVAALMPPVRVAPPPGSARGEHAKVPPPGVPRERWRAYQEAAEVVDLLYDKVNRGGALSDAEAQIFYQALRQRNALWAELQARPLGDADREALRLSVPVRVSPALSRAPASASAGPASRDRRGGHDPSWTDPLANAFAAVQRLEPSSGAADEELGDDGETPPGRFERLRVLVHVRLEGTKDEAPAAGAKLVDYALSRLPQPLADRAQVAKDGGKVYSNVAFRALDSFMVDAMNAVGVTFDPVAFRQRVKAELTGGQKGVDEWATGGK